jgi:MYXO-CTERM domain-containing protein
MRALPRLFPFLILIGCGPEPMHLAVQQNPIINGTVDTGDPNVMLFIAENPTTKQAGLCTASVVSPHVLLTAAHCMDPAEFATDMGTPTNLEYFVYPGNALNLQQPVDPSTLLAVQEVHFDPQFNPDPNVFTTVGHDVGVVILMSATTQTPIPLSHVAPAQTLVGQSLHVIGYGVTSGTDTTGATAGTKRDVDIGVSSVTSLFIEFQDGSHGICEGDSGGPALQTVNGVQTIVGITAFGQQGCPTNKPSADTRVDLYTSFIDGYIQQFDPTSGAGSADMATGSGGGSGSAGGGSAGGGAHHSSGGCSMASDATAPSLSWLLLGLPAFVLARRRRSA